MKSILAICPTRERVEKCRRMLDSFDKNKTEETDIVFCLDDDDPFFAEYIHLFETKRERYVIYYDKRTIIPK